jgi:hypothetical protein
MRRIDFIGLDGSNPLGFLAALGLLRIIRGARLAFQDDGSCRAFFDGFVGSESEIVGLIWNDVQSAKSDSIAWRFSYVKAATKKQGPQTVRDLKPPPQDFKKFLSSSVNAWLMLQDEGVAYAAAYATDVATDNNGNTKPTAFHFTAAQQTFLGTVDDIRSSLTPDWVHASLFEGRAERPGKNLRWDPGAERNRALMGSDPSGDGTFVDAPLEWLAFRGLPLLPSFPRGSRIATTGITRRDNGLTFTWPLWFNPGSMQTIRSVVQVDWTKVGTERVARGVFAICSSLIRRTSQGFGNFGPSSIVG